MTSRTSSINAVSRRQFLCTSGIMPLALLSHAAVTRAVADVVAEPVLELHAVVKSPPIGIELYAVRTALERNLPGTLRKMAQIGYEVVEFYSPYFQWSLPFAKDVRTIMDDLGLRCFSTHNHIESFTPGDGMAKAIELNQILGTRHLVLASAPKAAPGVEGWKKLCDQLSKAVRQLQPHGLSAGYHNHQAEWARVDGEKRVMDIIAAHTPPEFVLQLDVGTCLEAGMDPVAWIKAHPRRIKSVHLKDWAPGTAADEKGYRVLFGEGIAPWSDLLAAAEAVGGVEYYLMEQEGSRFSEFETAQRCLASWRQLRIKA